MYPVPKCLPEPIAVVSIEHPVERNQAVNQSYYTIGEALLAYLGPPHLSNWCIFGQFASRQVGEWIRELTVTRQTVVDFLTLPVRIGSGAIERAINDLTELPRRYSMFEPLLALAMRRAGVEHRDWSGFLSRGIWRIAGRRLNELASLLAAFEQLWTSLNVLHENLILGNQRIYTDIAPVLCRFLDSLERARLQQGPPEVLTFSAEQDPQGYLSAALALYREVYRLGRAEPLVPAQEELCQKYTHQANLLLGCHEQLLVLQPLFNQMRDEMRAMSGTMTLDDPNGHHKLLPNGGDWGDFYQRMGLRSPLPTELPHTLRGERILELVLPPDSPGLVGSISEYFARGLTDTRLHQPVTDVFPLMRGGCSMPRSQPTLSPRLPQTQTYWDALLGSESYASRQ